MAEMDPEVVATTQALLDAIVAIVDNPDLLPISGLLIFKTIHVDGTPKMDWVVTHDLTMVEVIGMTEAIKDSALGWFRQQDAKNLGD